MSTVVALRVHDVHVPLTRPFVTAVRRAQAIDVVLVEAVDSDGRSGWGEAATSWRVTGESPASVRAAVTGPLAEAVVGAVPAQVDHWSTALHHAVHANSAARAAVECAVLDLAARAAGVGFAELLSGFTAGSPGPAAVRTDMTLSAPDGPAQTDALIRRALELRDGGFGTLKVKVDGRTDTVDLLARLRAALGPATVLRIDANQAWTPAVAVRTLRACEDAGVGLDLVEQPVAARDLAGLAEVTAAIDTPVLADEAVWTVEDLALVVERHAADLVNVKLAKTAGPLGALAVAASARAAGLDVLIGCMLEGTVGVTAAAALAAVTGRSGATHDLDAGLWLTGASAIGGARYEGDLVHLPMGPGLGVRAASSPTPVGADR
ncbi:MAG: dipeptide epimerase [Actinobacteria bacterium]|nr:dipeptide epimerase [Actinomycetota bacterium]MCG2800684.1 dipeptide epimerase [Cellulomonas sp.]